MPWSSLRSRSKGAIPAIGVAGLDAEAMKRMPRERVEVADTRWPSADSKEEVDTAWEAEIARRIQQIDSGDVECIPWEAVMAELRRKFG